MGPVHNPVLLFSVVTVKGPCPGVAQLALSTQHGARLALLYLLFSAFRSLYREFSIIFISAPAPQPSPLTLQLGSAWHAFPQPPSQPRDR